jgi:hypothetical protein
MSAVSSSVGWSVVMQSCNECLVFMVATLHLARDGKVMGCVKIA